MRPRGYRRTPQPVVAGPESDRRGEENGAKRRALVDCHPALGAGRYGVTAEGVDEVACRRSREFPVIEGELVEEAAFGICLVGGAAVVRLGMKAGGQLIDVRLIRVEAQEELVRTLVALDALATCRDMPRQYRARWNAAAGVSGT